MDFIRRERIYIWMLFFIALMNIANMSQPHKRSIEQKSGISEKTIAELGITEEKVKAYLESDKAPAQFFKYGLFFIIFAFVTGVLLNLRMLLKKDRNILKISPVVKDVRWGISDIFRAVIIIIFSGYVLSFCEALVFRIFHVRPDSNTAVIVNTLLIDAAGVMVVFYFVIGKYKEKLHSLGLRVADFYKNALAGLAAYVFMLPILLCALLLSILVLDLLGYKPPPQPVFDLFFEEKRGGMLLFLAIFVSVLGPIAEEIFFRGFLYGAIKKRFGIWLAVLASAALFSMLHTNIIGFLPILLLGVLMAYLYETTASLVAPIVVHILHNSLIVGFIFFIKELLQK